jgi:hypothetical protein
MFWTKNPDTVWRRCRERKREAGRPASPPGVAWCTAAEEGPGWQEGFRQSNSERRANDDSVARRPVLRAVQRHDVPAADAGGARVTAYELAAG